MVFSNEQEDELVAHILSMEDRFFGLTTRDVRYIALQTAERNNLAHKFNKTVRSFNRTDFLLSYLACILVWYTLNLFYSSYILFVVSVFYQVGLAGKDWLLSFLRRHPQLSIRTPEPTSAARERCFNQTNVDKFFDILSSVQEGHFFPPHRLFNVDETGITTVQTKPTKIIGQRGKKTDWQSDFCWKRSSSYSSLLHVSWRAVCSTFPYLSTGSYEARTKRWCSTRNWICLSSIWVDAATHFYRMVSALHWPYQAISEWSSIVDYGWTYDPY